MSGGKARREDVVEILHGQAVADPYRWLEDGSDPEVQAWSARETERTERELASSPRYSKIRARLEEILRIGAVSAPFPVKRPDGSFRYFFVRQRLEEDQPVLFARDGDSGEDRVLVDPNRGSSDGTTSLDWWFPSPDGRLVAFGLSQGGDEQSTLAIVDVATGALLPNERITRMRFASLAWLPDASGFYYSRYPDPTTVPKGEEHYGRRVHEHVLGRDPDLDPIVFGEGRALTDLPGIEISPNGRWLVGVVFCGWSKSEVWLLDRHAGASARWTPIAVPDHDAMYEAQAFDDHLLLRTDDGAPTYRVYRVDPEHPARDAWKEIVPATKDTLEHVSEIGGEIVATYIADAKSIVKRFSLEGAALGEIALPLLGTASGASGAWNGREAFLHFTSFTVPARILRVDLDLDRGDVSVWSAILPPRLEGSFRVEQRRARSKDGTAIPYFVVRRDDVALDGSAPAMLVGYGGFNVSQLPQWSGGRFVFLERGGVLVVASLRGGGEYGEAWHRAGMLENKQNVFDDAIAVAEDLIATKVTSASLLSIVGGSNGGLLVGALVTQRPELFRAAVCLVPLLDMVRFHRFLIAKLWIAEYGSPEEAGAFEILYAYSPYHRVKMGTRYPAMLFATAEGDTRVDPCHARKMAALMQDEAAPGRRILLRVEAKAGHGIGKPISKRVEESALIYTFLFDELGLRVS